MAVKYLFLYFYNNFVHKTAFGLFYFNNINYKHVSYWITYLLSYKHSFYE